MHTTHVINGKIYSTDIDKLLNLIKKDVNNFFKIEEELITHGMYKYAIENISDEEFNNLSEEQLKQLLRRDPWLIKRINNPPYNICLYAVEFGLAIEFVQDKYKTKELCQMAVRQSGKALKFIKPNQHISEDEYKELCMISVYYNGESIKHVPRKYQTEELCTIAIIKNEFALEWIHEPTIKLCIINIKIATDKNHAKPIEFIPRHMYKSEEFIKALIDEGMFKELEYVNACLEKDQQRKRIRK